MGHHVPLKTSSNKRLSLTTESHRVFHGVTRFGLNINPLTLRSGSRSARLTTHISYLISHISYLLPSAPCALALRSPLFFLTTHISLLISSSLCALRPAALRSPLFFLTTHISLLISSSLCALRPPLSAFLPHHSYLTTHIFFPLRPAP